MANAHRTVKIPQETNQRIKLTTKRGKKEKELVNMRSIIYWCNDLNCPERNKKMNHKIFLVTK